jgi:hypothetical protein
MGFLLFIIGAGFGIALAAGAIILDHRAGRLRLRPAPPPEPNPLLTAVEQLHQGLFAPFGFNVAQLFNNVWKAAGLEERGIVEGWHD